MTTDAQRQRLLVNKEFAAVALITPEDLGRGAAALTSRLMPTGGPLIDQALSPPFERPARAKTSLGARLDQSMDR